MKKYLVVIVAVLLTVGSVEARIGWTLEQCRGHYGREVKAENAWCGGTAYAFIHEGLYIYAIFAGDGRVADITYFDDQKAQPISPFVRDSLIRINTEDRAYENVLYPGWDGRHEVGKLGTESFTHWTIRELNGPTLLVVNENHNGYQFRTYQQFHAEQEVLKASIAASKERLPAGSS